MVGVDVSTGLSEWDCGSYNLFFFSDFKLNWGDNIIIVDFLFLRVKSFDVLSHFKFLIFKKFKGKKY